MADEPRGRSGVISPRASRFDVLDTNGALLFEMKSAEPGWPIAVGLLSAVSVCAAMTVMKRWWSACQSFRGRALMTTLRALPLPTAPTIAALSLSLASAPSVSTSRCVSLPQRFANSFAIAAFI